MFELKIKKGFASAHQLRGFHGQCENLHGHNWKVEVFVCGQKLDKDGLLMDFKEIKKKTEVFMDMLDHKFLNDLAPFTDINPSSENISKYLFESLSKEINTEDINVSKVTVWESDTACASYYIS